MELRVLGPLELRAGDAVVPIRRGRPRKLLLALLVHRGARVSTDALIDALWGSQPPRNAVNSLQILVSYLRKALAGYGEGLAIETLEGGYRLVADQTTVDAWQLEAAVAAAPGIAEPLVRLERLDATLSLWRGTPLSEALYDAFAQGEIRRLEEIRLAALELRADALLELGRHVEAAVDLQRLVLEHPLRERLHGQLMTALYRDGRQAEALAVYERARAMLVEELGLDPSPDLQALSRAILEQSPGLQPLTPLPVQSVVEVEHPAKGASEDAADRTRTYPRPLTPILGREYEIPRLMELLSSRRLVTLTGPGGAGKTRLAVALVDGVAGSGRPVTWIDLAPATDRGGAIAAVVGACGLTTRPGDTDDALIEQLADRDELVVLDTCERVLREVRPLVAEIIRRCPAVSILATSRQSLGVPGELAWPVAPLSLPDPHATSADEIANAAAVQLFVERSGDRRPGFRLTDGNAVDVARIVWLLDGLPLAVELAAGSTDVLDIPSITRILTDRLRLLVDDTRVDRQHTLRSTIAWSYELLTADEALLFERLSVFAAPFTLEAALAVAGHDLNDDALQVLLSLARQSLLAVTGDDRFRLLDTVRAFAAELLAKRPDDERQTALNHARWHTEFAEEAERHLRGPDAAGWLAATREAMPELQHALQWLFTHGYDQQGAELTAATSWFSAMAGDYAPAAYWLDRSLAVVESGSALECDLLTGAGLHASSLGRLGDAVDLCAKAVQLAEAHGPSRSLGRALMYLGVAQWARGEDQAAAENHTSAAAVFEALHEDWGRAICLGMRARTAFDLGEPDAFEQLDLATVVARRSGDEHAIGLCLDLRARAEASRGHLEAAEQAATQSLELNSKLGYREGVVTALNGLGHVRQLQGQRVEARALHVRALLDADALGHAGARAESLEFLAAAEAAEHRAEPSAMLLGLAEDTRARHELRRTTLMCRIVDELERTLTESLGEDAMASARRRGAVERLSDILAAGEQIALA